MAGVLATETHPETQAGMERADDRRVEYSLTPLGWTITNAIEALSEWSKHHGGDVTRARSEYCLRGIKADDILHA
jgi:DNA-binding HxlR family transcriptional regulator